MRTISKNVYPFDELSPEAKEKAINYMRQLEYEDPWFIDEVNQTFEKFAELFGIKWNNIDYEEPYRNDYDLTFSDDILNLTGVRLSKYIWNNYKKQLFKKKYYPVKANYPLFHRRVKSITYNNGNTFNGYYSAVQLEHSCVLTGITYDEDILQPIYEFLNNPKENVNIETLMNDCIYSLCGAVQDEINYRLSDESLTETIQANEYEFSEEGMLV
jgi:hypothetical protein